MKTQSGISQYRGILKDCPAKPPDEEIAQEAADVCLGAVPSSARELFRANFETTILAAIRKAKE